MRYAAVIATWNARAVLEACVDSILAQRLDGPLETIVVDNASTDGTADLLRRYEGRVRVIRNARNMGFCDAVNQGAGEAEADVLFLFNSDTMLVGPDALQRLAAALSDGVGLVGPRYLRPDGSLQPGCSNHPSVAGALLMALGVHRLLPDRALARVAPSKWSHDHTRTVDCVMGALLGVRADAFHAVGGYWPLMYASEEDLAWKLQRRGLQVRYVSEASVVHVGDYSNSQRWSAPERAARVAHSELAFMSQHYGRPRRAAIRVITGAGYGGRAILLRLLGRPSRAREYAAMARAYARGVSPADGGAPGSSAAPHPPAA